MKIVSKRAFLVGSAAYALGACTTADYLDIGAAEAANEAYMLGETPIRIVSTTKGGGYTFVALHRNESTSVAAARSVIGRSGGTLVELVHSGGRNITFAYRGTEYSFDPNRIFTNAGIRKSLQGGNTDEAKEIVRRFAHEIIKRLDRRVVISLHNNSDGAYSVTSYQSGGRYARDAKNVYVNPNEDPDDFYFVTDSRLFHLMQTAGFNVALQSGSVTDDGSLSVYCARNGMPYVNVEAQHGHQGKQIKMLQALLT